MLRRSWILIGLFTLLSSPLIAATTPDRTKEDCVEACVRNAQPCYDKCEAGLKKCRKAVGPRCAKKIMDPHMHVTCRDDENRKCSDEKEINCDPQCSIKVLQCMNTCETKK